MSASRAGGTLTGAIETELTTKAPAGHLLATINEKHGTHLQAAEHACAVALAEAWWPTLTSLRPTT